MYLVFLRRGFVARFVVLGRGVGRRRRIRGLGKCRWGANWKWAVRIRCPKGVLRVILRFGDEVNLELEMDGTLSANGWVWWGGWRREWG
jgi:hypothetical protein